ncbi:MAG TPA: hypothetical protein VHQ93_11205 [Chitinophagaceae bacterium]|jgi:hypothetical protein|nr:hypothetical protein [Chitinophagaceae bacterium]
MSQQQNIEQQLWSYIDGLSTNEERSTIQKMIETNLEWKNKYHELIEMHQMLNVAELEQPSMRFTKNIMEEIAKLHIAPATKNYINKKIIWGITGFFITLISVFLIYGFAQVDWNFQDDSKPLVDLSTFNIGKFFNNNFVNGFMMVNVLLGLVLLDRVLANKRKKFHKQV